MKRVCLQSAFQFVRRYIAEQRPSSSSLHHDHQCHHHDHHDHCQQDHSLVPKWLRAINLAFYKQFILCGCLGLLLRSILPLKSYIKLSAPYLLLNLPLWETKNFKVLKSLLWLQIWNLQKKLLVESAFLFSKFQLEGAQNKRQSLQNLPFSFISL